MKLSSCTQIQRRYSRSVNLERDLSRAESVLGYVLTPKGTEILERVVLSSVDKRSVSAYTLTGVYGTGKSAFAHFLSSLGAPKTDTVYQNAVQLLLKRVSKKSPLVHFFQEEIGSMGMVRAVVTARREPVVSSVIRALRQGLQLYINESTGKKKSNLQTLLNSIADLENAKNIPSADALSLIVKTASLAGGLLLIVDEMGKNLEYAASNSNTNPESGDLYFLQQLAELSTDGAYKIFFFGLLHQSFDEYAGSMTPAHRNDWAKVQGRFEDIPFYESPEEIIAVMSHAIEHMGVLTENKYKKMLQAYSGKWHKVLDKNEAFKSSNDNLYAAVYPLHPVSARLLPVLCQKYAQNDRSLFTFLAGHEPHSFGAFIHEYGFNEDKPETWPTLKIALLYDYFIESSGIGFRPGFGRWVEIQEKVEEARYYGEDYQTVIKTIGLLNLLSTGGALKAGRELTILSLLDSPLDDSTEFSHQEILKKWADILSDLEIKGLIVYRKGLDEYRLWHGSDFNIEEAVNSAKGSARVSLAGVLNQSFPMRPMVAQKHSYETGTLRYFHRSFFDSMTSLDEIIQAGAKGDGFVLYDVDDKDISDIPLETNDQKPIIRIVPKNTTDLRYMAIEYDALKTVLSDSTRLNSDKVAKREVEQRLYLTGKMLHKSLEKTFEFGDKAQVYKNGQILTVNKGSVFNSLLSQILDKTYSKCVIIKNELINRKEITTQGANAQRKLMFAMLQNHGQERLGLTGYGPETSIFESVLIRTGIYHSEDGIWKFNLPIQKNGHNKGIAQVMSQLEKLCLNSSSKQVSVYEIYQKLAGVPFGVPLPMMPILFMAIIIKNSDSLSLYKDGSFIHTIGEPEIGLLLKKPESFSVKNFDLGGITGEYFRELETVFQQKIGSSGSFEIRNASLLHVVKPFIIFMQKLPEYTKKTRHISEKAIKLMKAVLESREPDTLLFESMPQALGFSFKLNGGAESTFLTGKDVKKIRIVLIETLTELQKAYENLLQKCSDFIFHYFSISSEKEKIREELRVRAKRLEKGVMEPLLRRFILAAVELQKTDEQWLSALIMVVADKPAESFRDEDIDTFEMNLTSIARRFQNLETLVSHAKHKGEGFEARKITITQPDGTEFDEVVWVDKKQKEKIENIIDSLLEENEVLKDNAKNKKTLMALLAERIINDMHNNELANKFAGEKKTVKEPGMRIIIEPKKYNNLK
jgi:hypothetical protein